MANNRKDRDERMVPLGLLSSGERAEIMEIKEGKDCLSPAGGCAGNERRGDERSRIEEMGIRIGKNVQMISNGGRGPMLIKVDGSRIAMGRGMAMKILVRREEK